MPHGSTGRNIAMLVRQRSHMRATFEDIIAALGDEFREDELQKAVDQLVALRVLDDIPVTEYDETHY
jgi:hypothetical protein